MNEVTLAKIITAAWVTVFFVFVIVLVFKVIV